MKARSRREFLATSVAALATARPVRAQPKPARIRFAAIGLNHGHINGQVDVVTRGGGQLVSFFAKEPELVAAFKKRYPSAALARSEREILEDPGIQLVVSASIPNERAPLGIAAMRHRKDFMVDKPGATTLEQVAETRRVQAETRRICWERKPDCSSSARPEPSPKRSAADFSAERSCAARRHGYCYVIPAW